MMALKAINITFSVQIIINLGFCLLSDSMCKYYKINLRLIISNVRSAWQFYWKWFDKLYSRLASKHKTDGNMHTCIKPTEICTALSSACSDW